VNGRGKRHFLIIAIYREKVYTTAQEKFFPICESIKNVVEGSEYKLRIYEPLEGRK